MKYNLVIGPIEADEDGFTNGISAGDRKELLEDAGWVNVMIEWLPEQTGEAGEG